MTLIILSVSIAGCSSQAPSGTSAPASTASPAPSASPSTPPVTTPANQLSTIEPSEMALQLSDLPVNFTIQNRVERVRSDVDKAGIELGWKSGYIVKFSRIDFQTFSSTMIEQSTSIYPIETMPKLLSGAKKMYQNMTSSGYVVNELSNPQIGDQSHAFIIASADSSKTYLIDFIKNDVYESLRMTGTTTDYELLKDVAKKAVSKIK